MPKVVEQSMLSWAIGLFYLVTSEIFSTGSAQYAVKYGIGSALAHLAFGGNLTAYAIGIGVFVVFVVFTRLVFFRYLENRFVKRAIRHVRPSQLRLKAGAWVGGVERRFEVAGKIFGRKIKAIERNETKEARRMHRINRNGSAIVLAVLVVVVVAAHLLVKGVGAEELTVLYSMAFSLGRIWLAFAVTLAISVPLGIYIVFMAKREESYMTLFQILASIPATILLPAIVIGLKGVPYGGELVAFFIFFLSGFWYMLFSIVSTKSSVQQSWVEAKQVFQVRGRNAWRYMYLKAILPGLITGGITAIAAEWNASIVRGVLHCFGHRRSWNSGDLRRRRARQATRPRSRFW